MAKKKEAEKAALTGAALSPCDTGEEITPAFILARPGQRIDVRIDICQTGGVAAVILAGELLLRQAIVNSIEVPIQAPAPGDYLLIWGVVPASTPWRAKGEVHIGPAVLFRNKKNDASQFPVAKWAVFIRVIA